MCARRADRIGQLCLDRQAGAVEKHLERFLSAQVTPAGPVMFGLVGKRSNQDLAEPGDELAFSGTGEMRELSVRLQKRFLYQVRSIEL